MQETLTQREKLLKQQLNGLTRWMMTCIEEHEQLEARVNRYADYLFGLFGVPLIRPRADAKWLVVIEYAPMRASIGFSLDGEVNVTYRDASGKKARKEVTSIEEVRDLLMPSWERIHFNEGKQGG